MNFTLNEKEQETLNNIIKSLDTIYDIGELKRTYSFTPTGIGNNVKVGLVGYGLNKEKLFEIEKDITDYGT